MKFIVFYVLLFLFTNSCLAGGSYIGKLQPYFFSDRLYLIPVEATITGRPACASRSYIRLPNETGDPVFNAKYSLILAYWASKQELIITGSGSCTSEGDEIIKSIKPK
jgi:hypothetical protein